MIIRLLNFAFSKYRFKSECLFLIDGKTYLARRRHDVFIHWSPALPEDQKEEIEDICRNQIREGRILMAKFEAK